MGLATTTACGHEAQGRELAGDHHVRSSVHPRGLERSRGRQQMTCGGIGTLVKTLRIFLNLFDGFAVLLQASMGLVEQKKVIVPFAERLLGRLVTGGQGGSGFGCVDGSFREVACGLRSFAEGMEILILLRIEAADGFGEPASRQGDQLCAAEIEIERGIEAGFQVVEPAFNLRLLLFESSNELLLGSLSGCGEVLAEMPGVWSVIVGCEQIGVDVEIAHLACRPAHLAQRAPQGLGLLADFGKSQQFERRFDAPRGRSEMMDALGRGFLEAGCDGRLEHQALTEKDSDRLRHDFTYLLPEEARERDDDTTLWGKLCATGWVNEGSVRCTQEVVMTIRNVKAMIAKGVTVGVLAGAFALAAPAKADAQQFAVGVQFGAPYYGGDYYARQRYEEYWRQQAWIQHERHEAWERQRDYDRYAYGYRDHDRDRRDHDDHRDWDRDRR